MNTASEPLLLDLDLTPPATPCHSLELNLILVFIQASTPIPIPESEILRHAQCDSFGYLTGYQEYTFLEKAWYLLRPINVPFKNKWIRDTMSSLKLNQNFQDKEHQKFVLHQVIKVLGLDCFQSIVKLSNCILEKVMESNAHSDSLYTDAAAIVAITLKLLYAFNDRKSSTMRDTPSQIEKVKTLVK